jgi:hypothetical protein
MTWYYAEGNKPTAGDPISPHGTLEVLESSITKRLNSIKSKYRIRLVIYYRYSLTDGSNELQIIKATSWLNTTAAKLSWNGFTALFSNGQTFTQLFWDADLKPSQIQYPQLQDDLIRSSCSLDFSWETTWNPQPPYPTA